MTTRTLSTPSLLARVARVARDEGLNGLVDRLKQKKAKVFRGVYGYLVVYPLEVAPPRPASVPGLRLDRLRGADDPRLAEVVSFFAGIIDAESLRARLAAGELGYVALLDGRTVGTVWAQTAGVVLEFYRPVLTLRPEEVYYRDAFVNPALRGRGIYTAMKELLRQEMLAAGKRVALSFIRANNGPSLASARRVGGLRGGVIGYVKIFRRRIPYSFRHRPMGRL